MIVSLTGLPIGYSVIVALTGLPIGYSVIVALTGLPIGYSVIVALTGLPIGYNVIVALTGLPIGYSVIVALTGLPIGYSVMIALPPLQLLGNITIWRDTLSSESLKQLAVDGLLNRHLLLSLKNSPPDISLVDKAQKVPFLNSVHTCIG